MESYTAVIIQSVDPYNKHVNDMRGATLKQDPRDQQVPSVVSYTLCLDKEPKQQNSSKRKWLDYPIKYIPMNKAKTVRDSKKFKKSIEGRKCDWCKTENTPEWRNGPGITL